MHFFPKGSTLIEAVVVLVIFGLIAVVLGTVVVWQSRVYGDEVKLLDAGRAHNRTVEYVAQDIRASRAVAMSVSGHTSGTSTLALEAPLSDANGSGGSGFDYFVYFLNGQGALVRQVIADDDSDRRSGSETVNNSLGGLQFTYDAAPVTAAQAVTLAVTTTTNVRYGTQHFVDTLSIKLRNR